MPHGAVGCPASCVGTPAAAGTAVAATVAPPGAASSCRPRPRSYQHI